MNQLDLTQAAEKAIEDILSRFELPEAFSQFQLEKSVEIIEGLDMVFRLPTALDTEWATFTASMNSTKETLSYSYIPRIMAACLKSVNGKELAEMVAIPALQVQFDAGVRPQLSLVDAHALYQMVYENIIGKIPYDLLKAVYLDDLEDWIKTAGGILEAEPIPPAAETPPPTDTPE